MLVWSMGMKMPGTAVEWKHTHAHTYMYNIQKHTIQALYTYTDANVILYRYHTHGICRGTHVMPTDIYMHTLNVHMHYTC